MPDHGLPTSAQLIVWLCRAALACALVGLVVLFTRMVPTCGLGMSLLAVAFGLVVLAGAVAAYRDLNE